MDLKISESNCRVVSIGSGKGGVGKTLTTINVAFGLSALGKKVLILDGDLGLANVDIVLGIDAGYNVLDVIENRTGIENVICPVTMNIDLIPSGSGIAKLSDLSIVQKVRLLDSLVEITGRYDYLLIDSGAGIGENVQLFTSSCNDNLVVTTGEPHSITDAYGFIKVMKTKFDKTKFHLLVNMVKSEAEGLKVFRRLAETSSRFLGVTLNNVGIVQFDKSLGSRIIGSTVNAESSYKTSSGQAWKSVAHKIDSFDEMEPNIGGSFWNSIVLGSRQVVAER